MSDIKLSIVVNTWEGQTKSQINDIIDMAVSKIKDTLKTKKPKDITTEGGSFSREEEGERSVIGQYGIDR